ncbi:MAG: methyltransferase domain-containing protein [Planctomycetes bacterium]|nr:methyltransferase domain-containing protein [Planctomycetota bacterium]
MASAWGSGWLLPPAADVAQTPHRVTALYLGLALGLSGLAGLCFGRRWRTSAGAALERLTAGVDALTGRSRALELVAVSILGLFLEVLLIRWHASELRAAAYFKNVTLLACFLGLGLGFAAANRVRLSLPTVPLALAAQVIVLSLMGARNADEVLRLPVAREWLWGVPLAEWDWSAPDAPQFRYWLQTSVFYGFFAALFVSTILIFVPLGQLTGRLMRTFSPLKAYTLNILGSLAGVVLFGVVSYLWWPPAAWFAGAGVLLLFALRHEAKGAAIGGVCLVCLLAVVSSEDAGGPGHSIHSPYQRLQIEPDSVQDETGRHLDTGLLISANKAYHLRTVNLAREFVEANGDRFPRLRQMSAAYDLPYALLMRPGAASQPGSRDSQFPPESVLVVGAGGGNDVAAALRHGAARVDAVEIDPAILQLGRRHHAERPYSDPCVAVHVDDARAFMRHAAAESYDLIVFGLLDSHTLLSGMSAVRLDNFVYTVESLEQARRLLKADGLLVLSFATGPAGNLCTRLHNMLEAVFGQAPRCFDLGYDNGLAFAVGEAAAGPGSPAGLREVAVELKPDVVLATDDWPFLYLQGRQWRDLPPPYFVLVGMLGVISTIWILAGAGRKTGLSPHFFFLGGAFLLIEVKGITELALVFGTTWLVSSIVIAGILTLILLANLFVTLLPKPRLLVHYGLLAASILVGYFVPVSRLLEWGWWTAAVGATILLLMPLFFAGVIFATSLRQAISLPRVFASNLLGAILGGLCEYGSLALGFRNLYLLGLVLYAASFLTLPRYRSRPPAEPAATERLSTRASSTTSGGEAE